MMSVLHDFICFVHPDKLVSCSDVNRFWIFVVRIGVNLGYSCQVVCYALILTRVGLAF